MNIDIVKARLPLWGGVLVLPILALGFYLDHQRPMAVDSFTQQSLVIPPAKVPEQELPVLVIDQRPSVPAPAAEAPGEEEPSGLLTPEEARKAVFGKENAVYEKATNLFEAEAIDVDWALAYEQSLRTMFTSHSGLMRVSVNTISCHTSMCRIEVFTPRDTDADYFTAMFYNALDNFREGALKAEASIARRMEQGMTSVYIARKGYTLGFY
jgi:hypothetical protein